MKTAIRIILLLCALLSCEAVSAQTNQPPAFSITTVATMWHGAGQTEAGTDAIGRYHVSKHWAARNDNMILPGPGATMNSIGPEICSAPKVSLWQVCGAIGFGGIAQAGPSHLLGDGHFHIGYDENGDHKFSFSVLDFTVGHGAITDNGKQAKVWYQVAAGIKVTL